MLLDDDRSILHTYYINFNLRQTKDKCENLSEYLTKFDTPIECMQTKENLTLIAKDIVNYLEKQNVNAGGSGCGCCAVVTYAYVVDLLKTKKIKNALIIATGALFSPVSFQQEKNIPTIAHAITLEVNDL